MTGKFYTFRAGDRVPSWLLGVSDRNMSRSDIIHNKHGGRIIFGRSCIVVRGGADAHSKIMPSMNIFGDRGVFRIIGYRNAVIGGVCGATGVLILPEGSLVAHFSAKREW